jgi:hypothetical protein
MTSRATNGSPGQPTSRVGAVDSGREGGHARRTPNAGAGTPIAQTDQRSSAHAIFVVNLLQDVSVLRPLAFMAARDFGFLTEFLVVNLFSKRDVSGMWRRELEEMATAVGAAILPYDNEMDAWSHLQGKGGLLFAGSESNLTAHAATHRLFRAAPPSFITVTLQHGFECVGLLQSREHDLAHGREVAFAADVVCVWSDAARLTSLAPSQRSKLHVTGPSAALQTRPRVASRGSRGLVCENLHSVRFNVAHDLKPDFLADFSEFCAVLAKEDREVVLRPHPGGQWVEKNRIDLPKNVTINNNPIYKVDLSRYAYGVSAPSSILIDMVLADIPTAVWRGSTSAIDAGNYQGLTQIGSLADWLDFSREATAHPARFLETQQAFLDQQQMPLDPADVYRRYAALFLAGARRANEPSSLLGAALS